MANIRVTTTAEIDDNRGRRIIGITRSIDVDPSDNPRFFYTFTRGACQQLEHQIGEMLKLEFGEANSSD